VASVGEVLGVGGHDTHRWGGVGEGGRGVGWRGDGRGRYRRSPVVGRCEAWGGGGRGVMLGNARSGGTGSGVAGSIGRREVERVARGRTGGMGGAGVHAGLAD
jgi:hypothetical protein